MRNFIEEFRNRPFLKKLKVIGYIIVGLSILYGIGLTNIAEFIKGMFEGL